MASAEAKICNLALAICRDSHYIESRDEKSEQAIQCDLWYDDTRDLVLRRADWSFARKRAPLIPSGTPPAEWGYSYVLPSDCLTARGVQDVVRVRPFDEQFKYAIESDGTGHGRLIYMDAKDAVLIYTMRATDPTIYPPEFVEAFSWKLAANIARPLDKGIELCRDVLQTSEALINRAAAMNYNEQKPDPLPPSDFFTSRLR